MSYGLRDYGAMVGDRVRIAAHREALQKTLREGDVVVDLGAGTGIMALLACQLGAGRVYAIEPAPALEIGRQLARCNGWADRIEFFQAEAAEVELPERARIVVADLRGVLPLAGRHLPTLRDAVGRFLVSEGTLIPARDRLMAAPVEASELYATHLSPWGADELDIDWGPARRALENQWYRGRVKPDQLVAPPSCWATIDYASPADNARGTLVWQAERRATVHGFVVWFEAELADGVGFTTGPEGPETIYSMAFFPWPEPLSLVQGEEVEVALSATLVGEDYVWRWSTRAGPRHFDQSTFHAQPWHAELLLRRRPEYAPRLSPRGEEAAWVLGEIDGVRSIGSIAEGLSERSASRRSAGPVLERVAELVARFAR